MRPAIVTTISRWRARKDVRNNLLIGWGRWLCLGDAWAADALVRYVDPNSQYRVVYDNSATLTLESVWRGKRTSGSSQSISATARKRVSRRCRSGSTAVRDSG